MPAEFSVKMRRSVMSSTAWLWRFVFVAALVASCGGDPSLDCFAPSVKTPRGCEVLEGGPTLTCGEGTIARDGKCVPAQETLQNTCGEGTRLIDHTCVSTTVVIICGDGTKLVGTACVPSTTPVPEVICGPGTHKVGNVCLVDSTQQPAPITCGTGTHLEGGVCKRDAIQCGPGTRLNATGNGCDEVPHATVKVELVSLFWRDVLATPATNTPATVRIKAGVRSTRLNTLQIQDIATDERSGYYYWSATHVTRVFLNDVSGNIICEGGGPDSTGIITINCRQPIVIAAHETKSYYLQIQYGDDGSHAVRHRFVLSPNSRSVQAVDAETGIAAEVEALAPMSSGETTLYAAYPEMVQSSLTPQGSVTPRADGFVRLGVFTVKNRSYRNPTSIRSFFVGFQRSRTWGYDLSRGDTGGFVIRLEWAGGSVQQYGWVNPMDEEPREPTRFFGYSMQVSEFTLPPGAEKDVTVLMYAYGVRTGDTARIQILPGGTRWNEYLNSAGSLWYPHDWLDVEDPRLILPSVTIVTN